MTPRPLDPTPPDDLESWHPDYNPGGPVDRLLDAFLPVGAAVWRLPAAMARAVTTAAAYLGITEGVEKRGAECGTASRKVGPVKRGAGPTDSD